MNQLALARVGPAALRRAAPPPGSARPAWEWPAGLRVDPAAVHLSDAAEQDGGGPEIQRDLRLEVEQQSLVAEMGIGEGIHDRVSSGGWYLGACRAGSLSHAPLRRAQTRAGRTTRGKT